MPPAEFKALIAPITAAMTRLMPAPFETLKADEDWVLFSFSDRAARQKLGFFREPLE